MSSPTTSRNLLHSSKLGAFHGWLYDQGYEDLDLKQYEVLRMRHPLKEGVIIVWRRLGAEHCTLQGLSAEFFAAWRAELRAKE